jgi:hypothetical protein
VGSQRTGAGIDVDQDTRLEGHDTPGKAGAASTHEPRVSTTVSGREAAAETHEDFSRPGLELRERIQAR